MPVEFISATHITPCGQVLYVRGLRDRRTAAVWADPEIGCDLPSIRGWDVFNDAHDYARHVLPLVREELAHRQATGSAPVLNPDSQPAAGPRLALA